MGVAPMIGAHENLSTAPEHSTRPASPPGKGLSIFHTPPPSASPSIRLSSSTHLPPSRLAARGDGLYSSAVSFPQGSGNNYTHTTIPSNSSYFGSERLQPHRMFTSPSPVPSIPTSHTIHGRQHAHSVGSALQSASSVTSAMSGPRPTPHLITKARPPPELAGNQFNPLVNPNGASASTNGQLSPINLGSTSPPSSSLLFSQAPANQILSPVSPPLSVSSSVSGSLSPVSTIPVTVAHSAYTNMRLQHDPTKLITMLRTAFSQGGTAISESDLQAVAYAQPNANYQTIIIALKRLQSLIKSHGMGMQQQQLLANYQALIAQVENLQALAQPQLQQALQQGQQAELLHQQGAMESLRLQQAALAHQQALLQQQAQQEAQLKIQMLHQQQQTAAAALQAQQQQQQQQIVAQQQQQQQQIVAQQQQQQKIVAQQQQQQQQLVAQQQQQQHQIVAQQQALLQQQEQANQVYQQNLQALQQQMAQQQQTATNMTQTHQSTLQQAQQQQQSQQQQQNQSNTASEVVSHLANALMGNGSGQSNQTEPTPSGDTGNSLFGTIAQGFLNTAVGNNQDPTSGISNLFGGVTQAWMDSAGGIDPSSLTAGLDFSSYGDN
jgi:hypothetical protein